MMHLIHCNWLALLLALLLGLLTAWWAWARRPRVEHDYDTGRIDHEPTPAPVPVPAPPPPQPVAAPVAPPPAPPVAPVAAAAAVGAAGAAAIGKPKIAAAVGAPDDLLLIKGVGPKLNTLLNSLGVLRFDQIASWTGADIAEVDQYLENFKGRIDRDNWVDQAGYLARGDVAGFEAKYGKMESK